MNRRRRHHMTHRVNNWTEKQKQQLGLISDALDSATEFGMESASRERLLIRLGEITSVLRLLRQSV